MKEQETRRTFDGALHIFPFCDLETCPSLCVAQRIVDAVLFEKEVHNVKAREGRGEVKRGGAATGRVHGIGRY